MAGLPRRAERLTMMEIGIDGFLLLMRLTGIEELGPAVLAVHRNVFNADDQRRVDLAVMPTLIASELVDPVTGAPAPEVRQWLQVLESPDEHLDLRLFDDDQVLRGTIVRRGDRFLAVYRHDTLIRLQQFFPPTDTLAGAGAAPLWDVLGALAPADLDPILIPLEQLSSIVAEFTPSADGEIPNRGRLHARLREYAPDRASIEILEEAAQYTGRRTEIVYTAPANDVMKTGRYAVGVMDTSRGRVLSVASESRFGPHVKFEPATRRAFVEAIDDLIAAGPDA